MSTSINSEASELNSRAIEAIIPVTAKKYPYLRLKKFVLTGSFLRSLIIAAHTSKKIRILLITLMETA